MAPSTASAPASAAASTLATAPRAEPLAQTSVFAAQDGDADAEIARIIAANLGGR